MSTLDVQEKAVRGSVRDFRENITFAPKPTEYSQFRSSATEVELDSLNSFVAPCCRELFYNNLDGYCQFVAEAARASHPFTPIRCHMVASSLLPLLPPDYAGGVWSFIDTVGKRVYSQHF